MATVAAYFPARPRTDFRQRLVAYARTLLKVLYETNMPGYNNRIPGSRGWGKEYPSPDFGLDCSGFVLNVLQHMRLEADLKPLYTDCNKLWTRCREIDRAAAAPGDLVFFSGTYDTPGFSHVGIVTQPGATQMISARMPELSLDVLPGTWQQFDPRYARVKEMPV
jgi:cell wall-associated NlpC family hydrolase